MKDEDVIKWFCNCSLSELQYYKGVIEALLVKACQDKKNETR